MRDHLRVSGFRGLLRVVTVAGVAPMMAACGGGDLPSPTQAKPLPPTKVEKTEAIAQQMLPPPTCLAKQRLTTLLAEGPLPPVPPDNISAALASLVPSGAKGDGIYGRIAPATVLIRSKEGMGSGVIINPDGWILTAYHVVKDARIEDFSITVEVEIGHLVKDGAKKGLMDRGEKRYKAVVHKADPVRDLAVLKITDPPKGLSHVKVAKGDVQPSDPITIVGHAGVGMLWGVKNGTVSNAGELGKNLSLLAMLECKSDTPTEECDQRKKARERALVDLSKFPAGVLIQSTVATTRGDSGGPVANADGEVVGIVSFSNTDRATGVAYSYHVHGSEIRQFLAEIPAKPAQIIPNPWCDGGFDSTLEDVDLDGKIDTLVSSQFGFSNEYRTELQRRAIMIDLDQNQFASGKSAASEDNPFDAEVIILYVDGVYYTYYDSDNDGRFDELLVDTDGYGSPKTAWKIAADGSLEKDDVSKWRSVVRAEVFGEDGDLGRRLTRVGAVVLPNWVNDPSKRDKNSLPDPLWGGGRKGRLADFDRDGRADGVMLSAAFSQGILFDADQNSLGGHGLQDNIQGLLNSGGVDAEFSFVEQGTNRWAWYDTDNDGKFDLALHAAGSELQLGIASSAWTVDASGKATAQPAHVGRRLIRPGLVKGSDGNKLSRMTRMFPTAAANDGLGSLPDPRASSRFSNYYFLDVKGWPRAIAVNESLSSRAILIDVDRNTKFDASKRQPDVEGAVTGGGFDAEFAEFSYAGMTWAFYDTDDDGTFDLVLFTDDIQKTQVQQAFRLNAAGALELDPSAAGGKWVRWQAFQKKPIGAIFKKLSKDYFNPKFIDE